MDCRVNKEFNPKTCRYVKECKPGQVRDEQFKCRSTVKRVYKSKAVSRNKLRDLKTMVNSNTNLTPNNVTRPAVKPSSPKPTAKSTAKTTTKTKLNPPKSAVKPKTGPGMFPTEEEFLNTKVVSDPETVFMFYSKSTDAKPGKGAGEKIQRPDLYVELSQIENWRKQLSNFWYDPFNLDGKTWMSVEHYYQGSKFKQNPSFYSQFSLESGTELSKDAAMAKAAGGKSGKYQKVQLRPKEIKVDADFFGDRQKVEMFTAQYAKFTQHQDLMRTLQLTRNATLLHYVRGSAPVRFDGLMYLRQLFRKEMYNENGPDVGPDVGVEEPKQVKFKTAPQSRTKTPTKTPTKTKPVPDPLKEKKDQMIQFIDEFKPTIDTTWGEIKKPATKAGLIQDEKDKELFKMLLAQYLNISP
jgi:predicted NAD-dependent protein-ADP-ribosyltransferase YbiA (DUF1768 family)